jgi:hypothetical protein
VNGAISVHGAAKAPTWVRLAAEPLAGATTLTLQEAVTGWEVNDQLVLPDTREDPARINDAQVELRTISAISGDRKTLTLSSALTHNHRGPRDPLLGSPAPLVPLPGGGHLLPHVMNLTRNIVIRSANPAGTRGHTLFTHRSIVDIRYAEFRDLGRTTIDPLNDVTNHIGRYALHMHHLIGPAPGQTPANGYQYTALGNSLWDNTASRSRIKWPIAIHNSHYGLISGNTVYNAGGAGLVTEDGSESFNVIERNMVVRVLGLGDREGRKVGGAHEPGSQGIGLWFRGPNNFIRHNVAANSVELTNIEAAYGFEFYFAFLGNVRIPNFKGADPGTAGQFTLRDIFSIPILQFTDNETYGNPQGFTFWWVGMNFDISRAVHENVFKNLTMWHISRYSVYGYPGNKITFDGLQVYDDLTVTNDCCNFLWYGDYINVETVIKRSRIVGIEAVILPYFAGGTTIVDDSVIAAVYGIVNRTSGAPGSCPSCNLPDRLQIIKNVRFFALPGRPLRTVTMEFLTHNGSYDNDSADNVYVYDYQGTPGANFRVFYAQQASSHGQHDPLLAGGPATCAPNTDRPEVNGIVCPIVGTPPSAPVSPAKPAGVRVPPQ